MPLGETNRFFIYRYDDGETAKIRRSESLTTLANPAAGALLTPTPAIVTGTPAIRPREEPRILYYRGLNSDSEMVTRTVTQLDRAGSPGAAIATAITVYDSSSASPVALTLTYRRGEGRRFFGIYNTDDTGLSDGDSPG